MQDYDLPQDTLNKKEQKMLEANLAPDEKVLGTCVGVWGQALVVTSSKVLILKGGAMAGQMFGGKVSSFRYDTITSVEVQTGLVSGVFEIATGGVQGYERNRWGNRKNDAKSSPNAVPFNRGDRDDFQKMATYIREHVHTGHTNIQENKIDIPEQIQKLDELRKNGILTDQEFESKKTELLARI